METKYGPIVIRRLNTAGLICFLIGAGLAVLFLVLDALWANGIISLPLIFRPQYQVLYFLWLIFMIICLGIDKITIDEEGFAVSTMFAKKEKTEKTAMVPVIEHGDKLFLIPIASSLGLYNPLNFKTLKKVPGVIAISIKYKDKIIERGYTISSNL